MLELRALYDLNDAAEAPTRRLRKKVVHCSLASRALPTQTRIEVASQQANSQSGFGFSNHYSLLRRHSLKVKTSAKDLPSGSGAEPKTSFKYVRPPDARHSWRANPASSQTQSFVSRLPTAAPTSGTAVASTAQEIRNVARNCSQTKQQA